MRAFGNPPLRGWCSGPAFVRLKNRFICHRTLCVLKNDPNLFVCYFTLAKGAGAADPRIPDSIQRSFSMIRFSYQLIDFRHWLSDFSNLLNLPAAGGKLEFPPEFGDGFIHAVHVADGYSFVVMDFQLNDDLVFFRRSSTPAGLSLFFGPSPSLSSTGREEEMSFARNTRVKRVGLLFPDAFLKSHIRKDILDSLLQYSENPPVTTSREPIA